MVRRSPPWSDLPEELLSTIANSLTSNSVSIITFRSVCRSWRSSCPPLFNPYILSPNTHHSVYTCGGYKCFLSITIICAFYRRPLQSSLIEFSSLSPDACVLFLDEYNPGRLSIRKPFSIQSYDRPINFPNNINVLDFNVRELGRFHNINFDTGRLCDDSVKVIRFTNAPAAITLNGDGTLWTYRFDVGIEMERVRPEIKHDGKGFRFDDIIEFKGRVLGVDRRGRVYAIKYHSSKMTSFIAPIVGGGGRRKRLVESLGLLYLVVRCKVDPRKNDKRTKFKVYELNEGMKKWSEITSLGDRSFLFGRNFSFSASARELGPCVKNCILFARFSFLSYNWTDDGYYKCHSILENNGLDIEVFHLHDADISGVIESYPGYSDSIWPPPSWIWPIDRLKRIGIIETAIDKILDKFTEKFKMEVEKAQQGFIPEDLKVILKLKDVVSGFKEEEIEFMTKLRQSMDILNKEDSLFEQATCSHGSDGTTEERHGWLDMLGNFYTDKPTHDHLLHSAMRMSRKRDAFLLYIEEQATEALKRKCP
ncbi:hypothetical protein KSS87_014811 [Heliosperma pusillum]|nr:hypothetical protein KSS87_014811 [Heliosperma pusillum]